jgi:hypothetical protein
VVSARNDEVRLVLPVDPRYIDVAVAAAEALAERAGVNGRELAAIRDHVHDVVAERMTDLDDSEVILFYEVGDGFLGLRVEAGATS